MGSGRVFSRSGFLASAMATTAILVAVPWVALAQEQSGSVEVSGNYRFNIPAKSLASAIADVGAVSGWRIAYNFTLPANTRSSSLSGTMTPPQAIERLLAGTGISYRVAGTRSIILADPQREVSNTGTAVGTDGSTVLETITVQGQGATTEGTGSYTTGSMSTATGLPLSIRETPQSVTVVTRQQINDQDARSLTEVLRTTTGMAESNFDTERSTFNYRGFGVDNYQYDGVPTTFSGPYAAGESDLDSIIYDRVEIVRGATGLLTGAGNPSAAINLVRKRATATSLTGEVTASAGSWSNYRSTFDISTPLNKTGTVRGRLVGAGLTGESFIDRYEKKRGVIYGTIEADITDNTVLRVGADYQANRPTASTWGGALGTGWFNNGVEIDWPQSHNGAPNWSRWNSTTQTQFLTLDHTFDNGWKGQIGYTHSKQEYDAKLGMSIGGLIDPDTWVSRTTKVYSEWYEGYRDQHSVNAKLDGDFELLGRTHEFMVGGSSTWQENYGTVRTAASRADYTGSLLDWNGDYPEPEWNAPRAAVDFSTRQIGLYSAARFSVADPLKILVGARYTNYRNDQTDTFNVISPYAGIVYDVTDNISLYASYTDIFQPQEYQDRNGAFLDPVEGSNYEIGAKGTLFDQRLNVGVSLFLTKQDNTPVIDSTSLVPGTTSQAYYGVDGTESKGFEIEVGGEVVPGWNVKAGYARFNIKDPDGVQLNTDLPRQTFNLSTTYQFSGNLEKLTVGGAVRWQSGTYATVWGADNSGSFALRRAEIDPYAIVNLMARYDFTEKTALQLNVNNLFNEKYYSQVSFYNTRNYGDPRNFTLKLSHKF